MAEIDIQQKILDTTRLKRLIKRGWIFTKGLQGYCNLSIKNQSRNYLISVNLTEANNVYYIDELTLEKLYGSYFCPTFRYYDFTTMTKDVYWEFGEHGMDDSEISKWLHDNNLPRPMNKSTQILFKLRFG